MIRIAIVDDHQIFVDGVKALLDEMPGVEVVAEGNNGLDLIDLMSKQEVDLVLLDVNMPKMDGIESTAFLAENYSECKILMLTMHDSSSYIQKLLKAGAHGYILKNTGKVELQTAIETLMAGKSYYSEKVTQNIMQGMQKRKKLESLKLEDLTDREKEVLRLIAMERTSKEIAEELFISPHTVESHRKNLISKLQVRGLSGLVKFAIQSGLVE